MSALVVDCLATINLIYMDPILVLRLQDLGVNPDDAGLGFALMAFTFTLGSGLAGPISEAVDKRYVICLATFGSGIALWLAGGLWIDSEALTFVGLGLQGLFVAGVLIPMIPEIINSTESYMERNKKVDIVIEE